MRRSKKTRVLLQADYLTKKVYEVKEYSGDGKGSAFRTEDPLFLLHAAERGKDVYFKYGKLEERDRDPQEYHNRKETLRREIERLKKTERAIFVSYADDRMNGAKKKKLLEIWALRKEKSKELSSLVKDRRKRIQDLIKRKQRRKPFQYECSVCMIIKDDNEYLEEWLRWHIGQGVEHFYIYDHGSREPIAQFMAGMPEKIREKVTVIPFGGRHRFAQHDAYNHCLRHYRTQSKWIGFIDSDEMVRVKDGTPLPQFLKRYEPYAGLFIGWITYNANGQAKKAPGGVRERFPKESALNDQRGVGKVFVQPYRMLQMLTHNGYPVDGYAVVDEHEEPMPEAASWKGGLTTEKICIDHYYTKSYEEWLNKISRGSCDPYYARKYEEFFKYNPDLEYCREEVFPVQIYEVGERHNKKDKERRK